MRPKLVASICGAVVVAACAGSAGPSPTTVTVATTQTVETAPPVASTVPPTITTTTAVEEPDLTRLGGDYVRHGPLGLLSAAGAVLDDRTGPLTGLPTLASDGRGGVAYLSEAALIWWPAGASAPQEVIDGSFEMIADGLEPGLVLVRPAGGSLLAVDLTTAVARPAGAAEIGRWDEARRGVVRSTGGRSAEIRPGEWETSEDGFPSRILEPDMLVVFDEEGSELIAAPLTTQSEGFARLHDFDGRRVIVSRGPFEPALPTETFMIFDLTDGSTLAVFAGGATSARFLSGVDPEGPLVEPDPAVCSAWRYEDLLPEQSDLPFDVATQRATLFRFLADCALPRLTARMVVPEAAGPAWGLSDPDATAPVARALTLPAVRVAPGAPASEYVEDALAEGALVYVWPAWWGVSGWSELSPEDQAVMRSELGEAAESWWTDPAGFATTGQAAVGINEFGGVEFVVIPSG